MGLFKRDDRKQSGRIQTVNGRPQPNPEGSGIPRRHRMFVECERRLADHPLTQPGHYGRPLSDGQGLEDLVATITPLFARERSLVLWVALRGAFTEMFVRVFDPSSAIATPEDLEHAMALTWTEGAQSHPDVADPWRLTLTSVERDATLGVASSVLVRVADYPRYSELPVDEALQTSYMPHAAALDGIAWCAAALLRLQIAQQVAAKVPEPDALDEPGWYPEPLFAKAERFWDGSDWTADCRTASGQRIAVPLV